MMADDGGGGDDDGGPFIFPVSHSVQSFFPA